MKEDLLEKEETFVLGLENRDENAIEYYSKLFSSYFFPVLSMRIVYKGIITNLAVRFKNDLKDENFLDLPGFGEFEITKSLDRMNEYTKEKEHDTSFAFIK
jgi:hypothetical protein